MNRRYALTGISVALILRTSVFAAGEASSTTLTSTRPPAGVLDASLRNEVDAAVNRGLDWLAAQQKADGSWSNGDFPALTALPVWAFAVGTHPRKDEVLAKATAYIVSCVQTNGGIYRDVKGRKGGGLSNYNTAICMTALHATGNPKFVPIVQNARKFIAGSQHFGDDEYKGGFGYDRSTGRAYTDLLNTFYAVEAMKLTQGAEDLRVKTDKPVDIDWAETVKFIERMQSKDGGFVYNPADPKAGAVTNADGKVAFRSYGSITYAGLLALIYASVDRNDVRVRSAFDWAQKHWSLEENPGMGAEGLFFFYNVLTRSLHAYGADQIARGDETRINWRSDVARKLISTQKMPDPKTGHGHWVNDTGRYWENDPVLVTSYALLALELL